MIGKRWLAWVGVSVLLVGSGFALQFAFDNRWIGDLGRVVLGLAGGVALAGLGQWQLRLGRRGFAQALTAGGATLLYLSTYASYGFYQFIDPAAAFLLLATIVLQTHLLAAFQRAPAIALMGQLGGFLVPVLLDTGQDHYWGLFSYTFLLASGAVLVTLMRQWRWISSVSFLCAHMLFWGWHEDHFHPEKLWPAVAFHTAIFVLFACADLLPRLRGQAPTLESRARLFANPLVFYATGYALLLQDYADWMGTAALALAVAYAGLAKLAGKRRWALPLVGIAGLFATVAVPVQLDAQWVTLGWGLQGCVLAWLAVRTAATWFSWASLPVYACAVIHYLGWGAPWTSRAAFTPVANLDFAGALALAACLLYGSLALRSLSGLAGLCLGMCASGVVWLAATVEAYSYFDVLLRETPMQARAERDALRWSGLTSVSVVWAVYSAALVGVGLMRKIRPLRWSGLALFGLTVTKVALVDIKSLTGGYRVVGLLVLGLLLLGVAWAYQRMAREGPR